MPVNDDLSADLRTAAERLAHAASCFIQCADVAFGEEQKTCQTHLWEAEQALRAALAAQPEPEKPTPAEHGVQIVLAHGLDCEGCQRVNDELSDDELVLYLRRGTIHDFQAQAVDRLDELAAKVVRLRAAAGSKTPTPTTLDGEPRKIAFHPDAVLVTPTEEDE